MTFKLQESVTTWCHMSEDKKVDSESKLVFSAVAAAIDLCGLKEQEQTAWICLR